MSDAPVPGTHEVVERGSVWYWVQNRHLYGDNRVGIEQILLQKAPTLCAAAGIVIPKFSFNDRVVWEVDVTDDWVAVDPERRAKLATATFLVEAPLPIRTQLFKHKYGFVENEVSRRYVDAPPRFYLPDEWRRRGDTIKQGSLDVPVRLPKLVRALAKAVYFSSALGYNLALWLGVCPEQARLLLAQGMETEWYWTGSLVDFLRVKNLRLKPEAQTETCLLVADIDKSLYRTWPKSWTALSRR